MTSDEYKKQCEEDRKNIMNKFNKLEGRLKKEREEVIAVREKWNKK